MSDRAWMPLDIDDYMADTLHLSAAEHGAYMLLIMRCIRKGELPDDNRLLARYAQMSTVEWQSSGHRIMALFQDDGTGYAAWERARGLHLKRGIPRSLRRQVYERDGRRCRYCGSVDGPFEIDHIQPWSRGGRHSLDNLAVACKPCNSLKGALTEQEFIGDAN